MPAKEAPVDEVIAEAIEIFAIAKPNTTHCSKVEAAHRGEMQEEPDLSAPAHAYYRRHMDRIKEAIAARGPSATSALNGSSAPSGGEPIVLDLFAAQTAAGAPSNRIVREP